MREEKRSEIREEGRQVSEGVCEEKVNFRLLDQ
jgi:hypothetical protein